MNFKYYKTESLVIFTIVLYFLCNSLSEKIEHLFPEDGIISKINKSVHTFSTLSLILLIFLFINYVAWKWQVFKWLVDIPNLNGRYSGELISSWENEHGGKVKKSCVMEIKQTASSVHIYAYFGDAETNLNSSSSHSVSEELVKENNGFFTLYYIFTNESEALQIQLNNHAGTGKFRYYPDNKTLEGEYYNQRRNIGTIKVKFSQKKILGRLIA